MTPGLVTVAVAAAAACALAGLGVPWLVGRLPGPAGLVAHPGLAPWSALWSGLAGGVAGLAVGWDPFLLGVLPLVPVCVALAVVDLRTRLLPKRLVLPATGLVVAAGALDAVAAHEADDLLRGLAGLALARSFYWLLWFVHSAGMGFGDVRLAALLGFPLGHLGWAELAVGMYAGFLVFAVPGLVLAVVRRDRSVLRAAYPFGPAMMVGALLGLALGPPVAAGLVSG